MTPALYTTRDGVIRPRARTRRGSVYAQIGNVIYPERWNGPGNGPDPAPQAARRLSAAMHRERIARDEDAGAYAIVLTMASVVLFLWALAVVTP